ncbi:xanthine dehydrogenase accessory protein XdhC [Devosia pacifica]|uniref:Xanthine dehydrogenase accessory protein XdhC n=1 Tax=Devosia pacifica TaxID=1335967 RepID=A0A918VQX8_9HYPH|nr:xanthine dehydrogenase accessory protein XdhC [Devosia pacifica]GHA17585.1 xanthine dehydrogenase accessory protein XdhC [Devosia pacifica]
MSIAAPDLRAFLGREPAAIVAELTKVRGSSPRAAGTFMLVGRREIFGTIGGGALEYMVIDHARRIMASGTGDATLDVPLGPEIGQCCGGRVEIKLYPCTAVVAESLARRLQQDASARPHVYVFGAGHVGCALARCLLLLPVQGHVIDTRRDALEGVPQGIEAVSAPLPEAVVRSAPRNSSFVILTHDHALDFMIGKEALARTDAPYVGMVGSQTKRARFSSWYRSEGGSDADLSRLFLPIGAQGLGDKRPEVIAALAASEIMVQIGRREVSEARAPATEYGEP